MDGVRNVRLSCDRPRGILAFERNWHESIDWSHAPYSCKEKAEMTTHFADGPVHLNTGELLDINDGEGFTVRCLEGSVWITQSNDPRDIVLKAGQSFTLDKPGLALVCAAAGP